MKGRYAAGLLGVLGLVFSACDDDPPGKAGGSGGSSASAGEGGGDAGDAASGGTGGSGGNSGSGNGGKGGKGGTSQGMSGEGTAATGGSGGEGASSSAGESSGGSGGDGAGGGGKGGTGGKGGSSGKGGAGGVGGTGGKAGTAGTGSDVFSRTFLFGGSQYEHVADIVADDEGNIYVAGSSESSDGDIKDSKHPDTIEQDAWLFKLDPSGSIVWSVTYDFADSDSSERFTDLDILEDSVVLGGNVVDDDDPGSADDTDGFVMRVARDDGELYFARRLSGDDDATESEHYDNDDEVTRVRASRSFTNSTAYLYEVLGQTMTRDSGIFPAAESSHYDGFLAFVHEPDQIPVGPVPADTAALVGGTGGPDTLLFFLGERGIVGSAAGTNDFDFDPWKDDPEGFSDIFYYDQQYDAVDAMVIGNKTDVIVGMSGGLFAGFSTSSGGDVPCVADEEPSSDVWFGQFDVDGPGIHCIGTEADDEGVAIFDAGDHYLVVGNTELPGYGAFAALGSNDDVFVMRTSAAFDVTGVAAVPSPSGSGSLSHDAVAALRLEDGTLVVAGDTQNDISETRQNHGNTDIWVTFLNPAF